MATWLGKLRRYGSAAFGRKATTVSKLEALLEAFVRDGYTTASGQVITAEQALRIATVFACVRCISDGVSQVPFRLMQATGDTRNEARTHPLADLLRTAPNDWMTSYEMRETMMMHTLLGGMGAAYLVREPRTGRVLEILPLPNDCYTVKRRGWEITFSISFPGGETREVLAEDVWYQRGPSWDTWSGMDVVRIAGEAMGIAKAAEQMVAKTYANSGRLAGLLINKGSSIDIEKQKKFREDWNANYGGSGNSGKTAILTGDWDWRAMSMSLADAQIDVQRRTQVEEICRVFRVMPMMVGFTDKTATYASVEQMMLAHIVHTLSPWYERLEQNADRQLLSRDERAEGLYTKFGVNALLRGAMKDRADYYTRMYNMGAINPNEIRALEDMNPYPAGNKYRVPLNMKDADAPDPEPAAAAPATDDAASQTDEAGA